MKAARETGPNTQNSLHTQHADGLFTRRHKQQADCEYKANIHVKNEVVYLLYKYNPIAEYTKTFKQSSLVGLTGELEKRRVTQVHTFIFYIFKKVQFWLLKIKKKILNSTKFYNISN